MGWQDAPEVDVSPMEQAHQQLSLTTQERALYQRHLDNLNGPGKVTHDDGSISTLYQMSIGGGNGKTYNIPSVYDGKILAPDEAIGRAKSIGLNTFPSYGSHEEAESRYEQMHQYMDKDVGLYRGQAAWMKAPEVTEPPSALAVAGNAAAKGIAGFGDMFLNAPVNAYNLAKAGTVLAGDAMGKDLRDTLEITPQPNLIEKGMRAVGAISDEREPQTPGQRILDMAVQSGVGMAANPAGGALSVARNVGMGVASGAAAGVTKEATGSDLAALAVGVASPLAARATVASKANAPTLKNPTKLQTAQEGMAAGYVVPPSHLKPSFTTNRLESLGGKAAVKQSANVKNVETTDRLVAEELGLPAGQPLTPTAVLDVRKQANAVYESVATLSPRAKVALERLHESRLDASDNWMDYARSRRVDARKSALAADAKSAQYERVIEREAVKAGQPNLVTELREARTLIAKTHNIHDAMNVGDGHVSASYLGQLLDHGKPLTGNLKLIGKFAQAFPDVMRDASRVPVAGVSALDAAMAAGLGTAGYYGSGGDPQGAALGALPLLRGPARAALLSKSTLGIPGTTGYQQRLLRNPPELNQAVLQSILAGRSIAEAR